MATCILCDAPAEVLPDTSGTGKFYVCTSCRGFHITNAAEERMAVAGKAVRRSLANDARVAEPPLIISIFLEESNSVELLTSQPVWKSSLPKPDNERSTPKLTSR